jgi:hypothetical protein
LPGPRRAAQRLAGCALALFGLAACQGAAAPPVPARLVAPDAATRAELQRAVAQALGDSDVILGEQALVDSSVLLVEHRRRMTPDGTRLMGRELETPERFRLYREGDRCVLEHERSGHRFPLAGAECAPETGD